MHIAAVLRILSWIGIIISWLLSTAQCATDYQQQETPFWDAWKVHVGLKNKLDIPEVVAQYVYECFYYVGRENWFKYDLHLCREMTFNPNVLIHGAYSTLKNYKRMDERLAAECFPNRLKTHYKPCEGLTWNIPSNPSPRQQMKIDFYKGLQQQHFQSLHKNKRDKEVDEHNRIHARYDFGDQYRDDSWQAMVGDCYMHRNQENYPACYGILWGYMFHKIEMSDFQRQLIDFYNHLEVKYPNAVPIGEFEFKSEKENHERMCKEERLRDLAYHCFIFHTWDTSEEKCRGISFGEMNKHPQNGEEVMLKRFVNDLANEKRLLRDTWKHHEHSILVDCFYFTTWLSNPKHECHRIVYGYSTDFSSLESRLQKRYDEMVLERAVVDCYYYHRYDDISRCRGITWDVKPMDNGRKLTPREAKIKQVWDFLKKDQAKRGADLPKC